MEIKPILKTLIRNPVGLVLISLQVALTLAIVVNALFIVNQRMQSVSIDSGLDEKNTLALTVSGYLDDYDTKSAIFNDLEYINSLSGVHSAMATNALPMTNSGWSNTVYNSDAENGINTNAALYFADDSLAETMDINLVTGRVFNQNEIGTYSIREDVLQPKVVIISVTLAKILYPEITEPEQALGKYVWFRGEEIPVAAEVIGLVDDIKAPWKQQFSSEFEQVLFVPYYPIFGNSSHYIIRTKDGFFDDVFKNIQNQLLELDNQRVVRSPTAFTEIRKDFYRNDNAMATMLSAVIVLLLVINALGIIGLVSFWVTQRTKQIGTRRALGATKVDILRYFITENLIISSIGVIIGLILAMALNNWLITAFELARLPIVYLILGALLVLVMGVIAVFGPAIRAANIAPAIATRSV
ncbi:ABC transporter permease [Sessilibacter sp. MAH1]